jgi:serine phosphatase RsbU (regulator of sigma subunit)
VSAAEEPEPDFTVVKSPTTVGESGARDDTGHYLVVQGQDPGQLFELGPQPLTIGREAGRDIVLADANVSRQHAQICFANDEVVVWDLGSTNGTFVDGRRITAPTTMSDASVLQVGNKRLKYERHDKRDVERAQELSRDLDKASNYVLSLLPAPIIGERIAAEWFYLPSARLGGDVFGYDWLHPDTFAFFVIDVSGHGIGAAMHSVSVLNVLRRRALPDTDFKDPVQVLASLNAMFPMDNHDGMYFTMWYGVYDTRTRSLTYASAGHHPAYLVPLAKTASIPLRTRGLMIGAEPACRFHAEQVTVSPSSSLYLFSDGAFEVVTNEGQQWRLNDFLPLLLEPALPGVSEPRRLYDRVKRTTGDRALDDDVSLLAVTFA